MRPKPLTPKEAWQLLRDDPRAVLVDIRSTMEFLFVGHPSGALHVACDDARRTRSSQRMRRLLAAAAGNLLARRLRDLDQAWLLEICDRLRRGETDLESAARDVLRSGRLSDE